MTNNQLGQIQNTLREITGEVREIRGKVEEGFNNMKERLRKVESNVEILPSLKKSFDNHLKHHQRIAGRWFNLISYIIGGVIIGLLLKIIASLPK